MVNEQRLVEEFLELVQIDSETKYERDIADVLKAKFEALGLHVIEDDTTAQTGHGAGNLICTLPRQKKGSIRFTLHHTWIRLCQAKGSSRRFKMDIL
ncbi:MAG: hypothetical protein KatS3mg080_1191 [Anoxybacillus sp.]|nr:MAG: hypothetical protein KatS3mg080_1191 [Anoxybacillus sp.]